VIGYVRVVIASRCHGLDITRLLSVPQGGSRLLPAEHTFHQGGHQKTPPLAVGTLSMPSVTVGLYGLRERVTLLGS
jgi:hypothetical protein